MDELRRSLPWVAILLLTGLFGLYCFPLWGLMWARLAPEGYDYYWVWIHSRNYGLRHLNIFDLGYHESLSKSQELLFKDPTFSNNPPPYYLLNLPFSHLSFFDAYPIYMVLTCSLYVLTVYLVAREVAPVRTSALVTLLLAVTIPYTAMGQDCLMLGQSSYLVAAMLGLTWWLHRRSLPLLAGFCLSMAIFAKVWPALITTYFLRRDRLAGCFSTLGWCAVFSLLTGVLFGFHSYPDWLATLKHMGIQHGEINQSFLGYTQRLYGPQAAAWLVPLNVLLAASLALGTRLAVDRYQWPEKDSLVEFSIYVMISLLFSAWSLSHHRISIYLPFLATLGLGLRVSSGYWLAAMGGLLFGMFWVLDGEVTQRFFMLKKALRQADLYFYMLCAGCALLWSLIVFVPAHDDEST